MSVPNCDSTTDCTDSNAPADDACDPGFTGPNCALPRIELLTVGFGLSCGNALSGDGSVVVGYLADTPRSLIRPFRWSRAQGAVELVSTAEHLDYGSALTVSADGDVIAGYAALALEKGAFRWTQATGITVVGPGDETALSSDGATLVGRDDAQPDGTHFYRWTAETGARDLGRLGAGAQVTGLSGDGTTVVGWLSETPGGASRAFSWTAGDGVVRIGRADENSRANAVSNDGRIVVGAHTAQGSSGDVAFRWDRQRGLVDLDLGNVAAGSVTGASAVAITPDGATTVGTVAADSWILSSSTDARLISEILSEQGADIANFSDFQVTDVSDDGTVVTGCLKDSTLTTRAFIARLGE